MLLRFAVTNYRSIKETATLSMAANSRILKFKNHTISGENKVNKVAYIYGGNASGKSNLIKAVDFSRDIILDDIESVSTTNQHFRVDNECLNKPGVFQYDMIINEKVYSYGFAFSYIDKIILQEWLYEIKQNGSESCIFERDNKKGIADSIEIKSKEKKRFDVYKDDIKNQKNKLFLKRVAENIGKEESELSIFTFVYDWFKKINVIFPDSSFINLVELVGENKSIKKDFEKYLRLLDTGIERIEQTRINNEDILSELKRNMPDDVAENLMRELEESFKKKVGEIQLTGPGVSYNFKKDNENKMYFKKLTYDHGNNKDLFEIDNESDGTKRLFDLLPVMLGRTDETIFFIDEIDRSLHPNLTVEFMELFYKLTEGDKSQLILTTHEDCLLNQDRIRKDEIWAVVREEDKSTCLYPMDKYEIRSDASIQKGYLLGIYGGVPKIELN